MKKSSYCIPPGRSFLFLLFTLVLTLFISCTGSAVYADIFVVSNDLNDGPGSLRAAIASAQDGDEINFDLAGEYPATIILSSQLAISKGITIQGPGAENLSISGNNACRVFYINSAQPVTISDLSIINGNSNTYENYNDQGGGGMYNHDSSPTVTRCTFSSNIANYGGGMYNRSSNPNVITSKPNVINCTFSSNSANLHGGGMENIFSQPTVLNCTFSSNRVIKTLSGGGGMRNSFSNAIVANCTFSSNCANSGGGMHNASSSLKVTNCTFSTNTWGMYNDSSDPTLTNCTFYLNSNAAMFNVNSNPTATNCIFWDSTTLEMQNHNNSAPTLGYCIVRNNAVGSGTHSYHIISQNPMLLSLADNGGPTQTNALQVGSPAIDAGTYVAGITKDQRGHPRPWGADFDIGAYEVDVRSFTINSYSTSGGTITPSSTTVFEGASMDFTVYPDMGYHIEEIYVDGEPVSYNEDENIYTFLDISANHVMMAFFALNEYVLSADVTGNGSVVISPDLNSYPHGTEVELTAIPGTGSDFTSWQGALSGDINPQALTMTGSNEVTATFDLKTFTITIDECNHGSITGSSSVTWGSTPTYTIECDTGYTISDVTVDGLSRGSASSLTLDPVKDNHTVSATFHINQGMVTESGLEEFTVTPIAPEQMEDIIASVDLPGQMTPESLDVVSEDLVLSLSMEGVVSGDVNPALASRDADEEFLQGISFDIVYSSDVVEIGLLPLEINMEIPRDELGQDYCEIIDSQAGEQGLASFFFDHVGIIKVISPDTYDLLETAWEKYPEEEAKGFFEISSDVENYYMGFDLLIADAKADSADLAVQAVVDSPDHYFFIFDGEEDGHFKDPIAAVKKPLAEESNSGGGGGGCNISALSATGLLLMAPVLFLLRRMK